MYTPQQAAQMQANPAYAQAMALKQQQQHQAMMQQQHQRKRKQPPYSQQQPQYAQQQQFQQQQQYSRTTGMGIGLAVDDEPSDFLLDDLDRVSNRDLALARYRRNHDLLNSIFDARRADMVEAPVSVYAHLSPVDLRAKLAACEAELPALEAAHAKRMADVRAALDVRTLSAEAEALELARAKYREQTRGRANGDSSMHIDFNKSQETEKEEEPEEEWAKHASLGPIVGIASLSERERTPDDVRAQIPLPAKAPELAPAAPTRITPPPPSVVVANLPVPPGTSMSATASQANAHGNGNGINSSNSEMAKLPSATNAPADDADDDADADGDADGDEAPSVPAASAASLTPVGAEALSLGTSVGVGEGELSLEALLASTAGDVGEDLDMSLLAAEGLAGSEASALPPFPTVVAPQDKMKPHVAASSDQPAGEAEAPLVPLDLERAG